MALSELALLRQHLALSFAAECPVTGTSGEKLARLYEIDDVNLEGVRVLDICSGVRDFAEYLRVKKRAVPSAVDIGYKDMARLITRSESQVSPAFLRSIADASGMYVYGQAHSLPFADGIFKYAFSFNGLLGVTDQDHDLAMASLRDAIRVIGVGGVLQVAPYDDQFVPRGYQPHLFEELKRDGNVSVQEVNSRLYIPEAGSIYAVKKAVVTKLH